MTAPQDLRANERAAIKWIRCAVEHKEFSTVILPAHIARHIVAALTRLDEMTSSKRPHKIFVVACEGSDIELLYDSFWWTKKDADRVCALMNESDGEGWIVEEVQMCKSAMHPDTNFANPALKAQNP